MAARIRRRWRHAGSRPRRVPSSSILPLVDVRVVDVCVIDVLVTDVLVIDERVDVGVHLARIGAPADMPGNTKSSTEWAFGRASANVRVPDARVLWLGRHRNCPPAASSHPKGQAMQERRIRFSIEAGLSDLDLARLQTKRRRLGRDAVHGDAFIDAVDRLHRLLDGGPQRGDLVRRLRAAIVLAGALAFRQRQRVIGALGDLAGPDRDIEAG